MGQSEWPAEIVINTLLVANVWENGPSTGDYRSLANGAPIANQGVAYHTVPIVMKRTDAKSNSEIRSMPLNVTNALVQLLIAINAVI